MQTPLVTEKQGKKHQVIYFWNKHWSWCVKFKHVSTARHIYTSSYFKARMRAAICLHGTWLPSTPTLTYISCGSKNQPGNHPWLSPGTIFEVGAWQTPDYLKTGPLTNRNTEPDTWLLIQIICKFCIDMHKILSKWLVSQRTVIIVTAPAIILKWYYRTQRGKHANIRYVSNSHIILVYSHPCALVMYFMITDYLLYS